MPYKVQLKTIFLSIFLTSLGFAKTTQDLLGDAKIPADVKTGLQALVDDKTIAAESQWNKDAAEQLQTAKATATLDLKKVILKIRVESEFDTAELAAIMKLQDRDSAKKSPGDGIVPKKGDAQTALGHHQRPAVATPGSLYIDVYQESPVLINYVGQGDVVKKMSFAVVTKWIDSKTPFFVRAELVSTGRSGHETAIGDFDIDSRHRFYVSHEFGSEMDYAQFFEGGDALHQTPESNYAALGGPASHGCVRNHELDAKALFELVGNALQDGNDVNVRVHEFGEDVALADGSNGLDTTTPFNAKLNHWLDNSIACTRRGENTCTDKWEDWTNI